MWILKENWKEKYQWTDLTLLSISNLFLYWYNDTVYNAYSL